MSANADDETEYTWQERFRDALANGNEKAVAKALREVNSLDRSAIEAFASLFEAGAEDHGPWANLYPHKLVFRRKRRGKPKDLGKHWVRDPQVVAFVEQKTQIENHKKLQCMMPGRNSV